MWSSLSSLVSYSIFTGFFSSPFRGTEDFLFSSPLYTPVLTFITWAFLLVSAPPVFSSHLVFICSVTWGLLLTLRGKPRPLSVLMTPLASTFWLYPAAGSAGLWFSDDATWKPNDVNVLQSHLGCFLKTVGSLLFLSQVFLSYLCSFRLAVYSDT